MLVRRDNVTVEDVKTGRRPTTGGDDLWELHPDPLCTIGGNGLIQRVNPAWLATLGYKADDVLGTPALRLLHPDDAGLVRRMLDDEARLAERVTVRCRRPDGSFTALEIALRRVGDGWLVAARDATAVSALEYLARRGTALLDALRDGVVLIDSDGRVRDVNTRFVEMFGFRADELIGTTPPYLWWPEEEHERYGVLLDEAMSDGGGHFELDFRRRDGELLPVSVAVSRVLASAGEKGGILAVVRDVSEQEAERERLREAHEAAKLVSWEWDPADDALVFETFELVERSGVELHDRAAPTLEELLRFVPEPYRTRHRAGLHALADGSSDTFFHEMPVEVPNTAVAWVETRARAVRRGGRTIVRGISQDVSERMRARAAVESSEQRLRQAQRVAALGSFEVRYDTEVVVWSDEMCRLVGIAPEDFQGTREHARSFFADTGPQFDALVRAIHEDGRPRQVVHRFVRADGEERWAETRLEAMRENGAVTGIRGTLQDITERRRAEHEIAIQAGLLDAVNAAVIATDLDGRVTHWNAEAECLYGWTPDEVVGRPITELTVGPEDVELAEAILETIRREGRWEGEFEVRRKDGTRFAAQVRNALVVDERGQPAGIVGVSIDATERIEAARELRAARDYLTAITGSMGEGLFTLDPEGRLSYMNQAAEELLGWAFGELGGEVMHERIHFRHPDGTAHPSEECPIRRARESGETVRVDDDVFVRRDGTDLPVEYTAAPFETSDGVRGSVVVFSDITARKEEEQRLQREIEALSWVGRIRDALAQDRFVLYAQPIVDLRSGETVSHELLIRMRDVDGTIVPPGEFLPTAEQYGLITEIDRWVLRQACAMASAGHAIELNLSAQSLGDRAVLEELAGAIESSGADPSLLVVELTETALLSDPDAGDAFVRRLAELGCGLALDDFGTGYGGFTYLKRLPVDFLKIDTEFVRDLPDNPASQHVVKAVVNLASGFGQKTVAEGVEDAETLVLLSDFGVDYAQGYHLGRPAPVDEVLPARS